MKRVKLIGPGLKLQNKWHWINDVVDVSDKEYENNKEYLMLLEDVKLEERNDNTIKNNITTSDNNILIDGNENISNDGPGNNPIDNNPIENNPVDNNPIENNTTDEEMEILKEKAKKLGINPGNMRKETLLKKIEEVENSQKV